MVQPEHTRRVDEEALGLGDELAGHGCIGQLQKSSDAWATVSRTLLGAGCHDIDKPLAVECEIAAGAPCSGRNDAGVPHLRIEDQDD